MRIELGFEFVLSSLTHIVGFKKSMTRSRSRRQKSWIVEALPSVISEAMS